MEKEKIFTLVMEKISQIKKMEQDMEALIKRKEKWEEDGTSVAGTSVGTSARTSIVGTVT